MDENKGNKTGSFCCKDWVFGISFGCMLLFAIIFGFMGNSKEMLAVILAGLLGMGFSRLNEIVEISGLGIKLKTRKLDKKIIELEDLKNELEKQRKQLEKTSDYMINAFAKAFIGIGALHIKNQDFGMAVEVAMNVVQLYAYNPKESIRSSADAVLSGISGWLSSDAVKTEIAVLLKEKELLVLSDYTKMKENDAPDEIIKKYEKIMEKVGIEYRKVS